MRERESGREWIDIFSFINQQFKRWKNTHINYLLLEKYFLTVKKLILAIIISLKIKGLTEAVVN